MSGEKYTYPLPVSHEESVQRSLNLISKRLDDLAREILNGGVRVTESDLEYLKTSFELNAVRIASLATDIERIRGEIETAIELLKKITDRMG